MTEGPPGDSLLNVGHDVLDQQAAGRSASFARRRASPRDRHRPPRDRACSSASVSSQCRSPSMISRLGDLPLCTHERDKEGDGALTFSEPPALIWDCVGTITTDRVSIPPRGDRALPRYLAGAFRGGPACRCNAPRRGRGWGGGQSKTDGPADLLEGASALADVQGALHVRLVEVVLRRHGQ